MLLNSFSNYPENFNKNEDKNLYEQSEINNPQISNTYNYKNKQNSLPRFLQNRNSWNNCCNVDEDNDNTCCRNNGISLSSILFFVLIFLIIFYNSDNF